MLNHQIEKRKWEVPTVAIKPIDLLIGNYCKVFSLESSILKTGAVLR